MADRVRLSIAHLARETRRRLSVGVRSAGSGLRRAGFLAPAGLTLYLVLKGFHPGLPGWSCPMRALTGLPCPTCFLTRATAAALAGQFEDSVRLHAFGPLFAAGLVAWTLASIHRRRFLPLTIRGGSVAWLAVALVAYWLLRLVLEFGFGVPSFVRSP